MSNPTSSFGWQMPTASDLVTDLPADFEVFGQAVDTTLADLKGGTTGQVLSKASNTDMDFTWVAQDDSNAIQNSLLTTTGDTIYASGASTPARLGIGTTGQVLTVSGGVPTWATAATGGMSGLTLLNSGNTSVGTGTSKTWTGLSGYQNLIVNVTDITTGGLAYFRIETGNGTSNVNWDWQGAKIAAGSTYSASNFLSSGGGGTDFSLGVTTDGSVSGFFWLMNADKTGLKFAEAFSGPTGGTAGSNQITRVIKGYESTAGGFAISQITIAPNSGNFSGGTVRIWGA